MAVAEHGRQRRILDALGDRGTGPRAFACVRIRQREAERFERRRHLGFEIARELSGAFRVLALGRDRDPAREIGLEGAGVEIRLGAGDGGGSAHAAILVPPS